LAELIEEGLDRPAVAAGGRSHQPAAVVVDDDGQIALTRAVRYLVDPDPAQAGEQVDIALGLGGDALADAADPSATRSASAARRGLGCVDRQPRRLVLERAREPRAVPGPRDRADDHAVAATGHSGGLGLDERHRRPRSSVR
jgi:hypothetical protein